MTLLRFILNWLFRRSKWDSIDYGTTKADDELNRLNGQL